MFSSTWTWSPTTPAPSIGTTMPSTSTVPTADSSSVPTTSTSTSSTPGVTKASDCDWLYVNISGFDGTSADELNTNTTLQSEMANITHEAIAESASAIVTETDSFSVHFQNASEPLFSTFSYCASTQQQRITIRDIIISHISDITEMISDGFADTFGFDSGMMAIQITKLSKLSRDFVLPNEKPTGLSLTIMHQL